jgi:hypothetical protein
MNFFDRIRELKQDPASLEDLYQQAVKEKTAGEFSQAVDSAYQENPENLLLAAWYYRLQHMVEEGRVIFWRYAAPLALICGLIIWLLSDEDWTFVDRIPFFMVVWAPIAAIAVMAYLALSARKGFLVMGLLSIGLAAVTAYSLLVIPGMQDWARGPSADLATVHLPVLSLAAVGVFVTQIRSSASRRFAFVIKTLEVTTTGGLFAVAIGIFAAVTFALFSALDINVPDLYQRLIFAGGGGMLPVLAVAIIYNPLAAPDEQDFNQGLSKFLANLLRIMIIPTLLVAVLYVFFIPFNFMEPFRNRDVLFIYNGMLFAVMGLLVGATPIDQEELSPRLQFWLRSAILAVASLAVLVSLYALSAILYRTWNDGLTMNRMTVIGWNLINIAILVLLLIRQLGSPEKTWSVTIKRAFNVASVAYTIWAAFIVVAVPILYH